MFESLALNGASDIATQALGLFAAAAGWKMSGVRFGPLRAVSLAMKSKIFRGFHRLEKCQNNSHRGAKSAFEKRITRLLNSCHW